MLGLSKTAGVGVLSMTLCLGLSTTALSVEREVSGKPDLEQGEKAIHGTIVKVVKRDTATHTWDVSVENKETGELVPLYLDKATARKVTDADPTVGDRVIVKYQEDSGHATSFVAVAATTD